ncbi:hypothetical protein HanIR_Chr03g0143481 [Helianthus annuus]|nr:hypothetical protein HanIR_Chr03g0143481 [Helianthus annuus]
MGDNQQQNYQANMTRGETSKKKGASVIPVPRKQVSTMVVKKTTKFVMEAAKNVKNKNKVNPGGD